MLKKYTLHLKNILQIKTENVMAQRYIYNKTMKNSKDIIS